MTARIQQLEPRALRDWYGTQDNAHVHAMARLRHKPTIVCLICGRGPRDGQALKVTPVGRMCKGGHRELDRDTRRLYLKDSLLPWKRKPD